MTRSEDSDVEDYFEVTSVIQTGLSGVKFYWNPFVVVGLNLEGMQVVIGHRLLNLLKII